MSSALLLLSSVQVRIRKFTKKKYFQLGKYVTTEYLSFSNGKKNLSKSQLLTGSKDLITGVLYMAFLL